jgi:long-chain acyl-CoA synthetase
VFGLTESSPVTHVNPFNGNRKVGSIGIPIPETECKIVDLEDSTREMPVGEAGELLMRGPQIMKGYSEQAG